MGNIAFIGVGNMGRPMSCNLKAAGHDVKVYDLMQASVDACVAAGLKPADSIADACKDAEVVITMLPEGRHVRGAYEGTDGIIANAEKGALLIDSSTIDVDTARDIAKQAAAHNLEMIDAPVSGGVGGAEAATLTFMVGGDAAAFARAKPLLEVMGKNIVHAGGAGNGQVAKICNNMILGISMIGVSEAFVLGEKLGLDHQTLFDISSTSSGQCWSLTSYCPVPGPVPASPANRDYVPGFSADNMLKDLKLSQAASATARAATSLGETAARLYEDFIAAGGQGKDFSGIINRVREKSK